MKTLDEVRTELWEAGQKYGTACIELGLSKEAALKKYTASMDPNTDENTFIIAKCSIAFSYKILPITI